MEIENKKNADVCPGKEKRKLGLDEVKEKLTEARGPRYWRTLDELAETPEFEEMLHREFPRAAMQWASSTTRRDVLKVMGASLALGGLSACVKLPLEPIVPYVRQPEEMVLGKPLFFASTMPFAGQPVPVLVESHEGRPTKIEGNPQHPATMGGSDVFSQASVLGMYDPDRSQNVLYRGEMRSWAQMMDSLRKPIADQKAKGGAGLRFLTGSTTSPTLIAQMKDVQRLFPQSKWYQWEPVNRDNVYEGAKLAFGQPVETQFNFEKAKIIVSLDSEFLSATFPGFHKYALQFAKRRRPELKEEMVRMYSVQSTPTNTSAKADHHLRMKASEIENFARALASQLGVGGAGGSLNSQKAQQFAAALVKDLQANHGRAVVVVGDQQSPAVHALAHAINSQIGAVGQTVLYSDPVDSGAGLNKTEQLKSLVDDMNSGKVEMLVISSSNPLYDAPADLGFFDAMQKVSMRIHHGLYQDETAKYCHWHVNATHYLEQWGDARTFEGTSSVIQPLIAPLYSGRSEYELFATFQGQEQASGFDVVQAYWKTQHPGGDFNNWWRQALHDGFIANSAAPTRTVAAKNAAPPQTNNPKGDFEIMLRPDPAVYDGRFANNAWLQENPKPYTQVCWDNAVLVSVDTAKKLKLETEDEIEISAGGQKVKGAVWLTPGHPDDAVTVFVGYGREKAGRVGSSLGFNAYRLRSGSAQWVVAGSVKKTGDKYPLASPQGQQSMEGRAIVRAATLEEFMKEPAFAHEMVEAPAPGLSMYQAYEYKEHKWGMAIDLNSCIGCNACRVACYSENNISVVGKTEVKRGHIMHWLRVDVYHEGTPQDPKSYFQPLPCMQCEDAPCEVVCPVGATVHSSEGLNDMVYNRCVGTRYCSNNCPYKVRRFNFLLYSDWDTQQLKFQRNPDVSVRSRGVMEKCTYCVQRITEARITAEEQNRKVADGEVLTACQQACPADAIVFGDMNDKNSRVSKLKASERNYGLLEDLNTRPRTTYLAAVRNPNMELEAQLEKGQES
jgi:MoCo/4Fe-4S cofactor protein with predicted Tat translocation signal